MQRLTQLAIMGAFLSALGAAPLAAAPASHPTRVPTARPTCVPRKQIVNWTSAAQLQRSGFNIDQDGSQATVSFPRPRGLGILDLALHADPTHASYTASRITEVDSDAPIADRVKCWQPTSETSIIATYAVRFDQATAPALTENLLFWNAPLAAKNHPEPARLFTAFGVSRSQSGYNAVIAQDLNSATFQGTYFQQAMPTWLNASRWHAVRVTITTATARVEVAQAGHPFTTVLQAALPHAPEPVAFEFSVDNELAPGIFAPVTTAEELQVAYLDIRRTHTGADIQEDAGVMPLVQE